MPMIFITGGAGFIGANFIHNWFNNSTEPILNIDKLTYAGNLQSLEVLNSNSKYQFAQACICDPDKITELLAVHKPRAILNFAAESHVDRSIHGPSEFMKTNILGTFNLLECVKKYWSEIDDTEKQNFRFLHVSTDEVYGSLNPEDDAFTEATPYSPNSPYSASKASSDHLVRAYHHTYGLPVLTTNCSNNYGPFQFPEKLIPLVIHNALKMLPIPIYGDGKNIRDWLYVTDHCEAIEVVLAKGRPGETYNIGGWNEFTNVEVIDVICSILDNLKPRKDGRSYSELKTFVKDRAGHDKRYAIDARKIEKELGWKPKNTFEAGIFSTVKWYLENAKWVENVVSGEYKSWITTNYKGQSL